jgi:hypothetical protein
MGVGVGGAVSQAGVGGAPGAPASATSCAGELPPTPPPSLSHSFSFIILIILFKFPPEPCHTPCSTPVTNITSYHGLPCPCASSDSRLTSLCLRVCMCTSGLRWPCCVPGRSPCTWGRQALGHSVAHVSDPRTVECAMHSAQGSNLHLPLLHVLLSITHPWASFSCYVSRSSCRVFCFPGTTSSMHPLQPLRACLVWGCKQSHSNAHRSRLEAPRHCPVPASPPSRSPLSLAVLSYGLQPCGPRSSPSLAPCGPPLGQGPASPATCLSPRTTRCGWARGQGVGASQPGCAPHAPWTTTPPSCPLCMGARQEGVWVVLRAVGCP